MNPTDFRAAADVPDDINPLDEENGDPIMSAGIPHDFIYKFFFTISIVICWQEKLICSTVFGQTGHFVFTKSLE